MGQAKRRGTFEERRAQAIARREEERIVARRRANEVVVKASGNGKSMLPLLALAALAFGGGHKQ